MNNHERLPLIDNDGLVATIRNLYHPMILYNCTGGMLHQLSKPSAWSKSEIFRMASREIAQDVFAAGDDWEMISGILRRSASVAALPPDQVEQELASAADFGQRFAREWILVARSFVFEAGKSQFVHVASGKALTPEAFDLEFGCVSPAPDQSFARFLCASRYVLKVQAVVEDGSCSSEFFLERGRLHLRLSTCFCHDELPALLCHLEP